MRQIAGLRSALRSRANRGRISNIVSHQAPTLGWNARDPIADMKPGDAIVLDDMFPTPADVMLRKGIADHVTGVVDQIESLMPYNTPAGTQTLFAAAGTSFFDITSAGAVGAAVVTGLSNARWHEVNYTNSSGDSYLCCFNGVDDPQYWNNSAWLAITGISTPAITGLTPSTIVSATVHQRRMWFVQKDTLDAWYLAADSVGGAATKFSIAGMAKRGGYIMAIDTWTLDAGAGTDDFLVIVTSEGEIVVYAGTDPSSASTWVLKGVWYIGQPIGRRCLKKFGGDLLLVLINGVFPLSKALLSASIDRRVALTDKIDQAMNTAALNYSGHFGWELCHYPAANMLLLNIPVNEGSLQQQYVMNVLTGAWCRFTGYAGNCFAVFNGELYMGGSGKVSKAWSTFADNDIAIIGIGETAFDYFNSRTKKSFKMLRPIFASNGSPSISAGMDVDYNDTDRVATVTFNTVSGALWGISLWGIGLWGSGLQTLRNWIGISEIGLCAATRLHINASGIEVRWQATDYLFEVGEGIV
jgi:hypothetical protein